MCHQLGPCSTSSHLIVLLRSAHILEAAFSGCASAEGLLRELPLKDAPLIWRCPQCLCEGGGVSMVAPYHREAELGFEPSSVQP